MWAQYARGQNGMNDEWWGGWLKFLDKNTSMGSLNASSPPNKDWLLGPPWVRHKWKWPRICRLIFQLVVWLLHAGPFLFAQFPLLGRSKSFRRDRVLSPPFASYLPSHSDSEFLNPIIHLKVSHQCHAPKAKGMKIHKWSKVKGRFIWGRLPC